MIPEAFVGVGPTFGLIVSWWVIGIALASVAIGYIWLRLDSRAEFGPIAFWGAGVMMALAGVVSLLIAAWPISPAYWSVYRVSGEVTSVTNTLVDSSGKLTTNPVITLSTVPNVSLEVADPRVLNLNGKQVELTCAIDWHYQAMDTYSCAIYSIGGTK